MSDTAVEAEQSAAAASGNRLASARTAAGLAVIDVARQLKLSPWQIEALESGDYARLPGPVFVRGFIRNYARLLKLDPVPLLGEIAGSAPAPASAVPEAPPTAGIPFPGQRSFKWQPYAICALLIVAALVGYEFYGADFAPTDVDTRAVELPAPQVVAETKPAEPPPAASTETLPPAAATPVIGPPVTAASPRSEVVPAVKAPPRSEVVPAVKPAPEPRPAKSEPAAGERVVRMIFNRESWVEVRDRQGRTIFSQLNSAGTIQEVSGQPPLRLVVGNAGGVRMMYKDQPVDLAPHTQVDVARLTLE